MEVVAGIEIPEGTKNFFFLVKAERIWNGSWEPRPTELFRSQGAWRQRDGWSERQVRERLDDANVQAEKVAQRDDRRNVQVVVEFTIHRPLNSPGEPEPEPEPTFTVGQKVWCNDGRTGTVVGSFRLPDNTTLNSADGFRYHVEWATNLTWVSAEVLSPVR